MIIGAAPELRLHPVNPDFYFSNLFRALACGLVTRWRGHMLYAGVDSNLILRHVPEAHCMFTDTLGRLPQPPDRHLLAPVIGQTEATDPASAPAPEEAALDESVRELLEVNSHNAFPEGPTIECAHQIMRVHRACGTDFCARKKQAMQVLIAAGRVVPDSSRAH